MESCNLMMLHLEAQEICKEKKLQNNNNNNKNNNK